MNNGSILKTLLSQRGMTIKDLAQKTGISIHTLYSITKRNSDNIRRVNLVKIFKALGVSELEFYSLAMDVIVKDGRSEGKEMTNADRIRLMTDEELMHEICGCRHCIQFGECKADGTQSCDEGIFAWLKEDYTA